MLNLGRRVGQQESQEHMQRLLQPKLRLRAISERSDASRDREVNDESSK
jgi:hypothetical protein